MAAACIGLFAHEAHALDLMQAWQGAQQHAPDAAAARAARDAGAARAEQARALWRPSVSLEGGVSYASSETATRGAQFAAPGFGSATGVAFDTSVTGGTATRYAIGVRQPIYSRERSARSESLALAAEAAEHDWVRARQALMLRTAELYVDAALAGERLELLRRQQRAVDRAATEARDRFRLGDRPVTDVHEAAARAAAIDAERLEAESSLTLARQALADLTGQAVDVAPPGVRADTPLDDIGGLNDWLARAAQRNPELGLAQVALRASQAEARASSGAFAPSVDLVASLARERVAGTGDFGSASATGRNGAIGVQVAIPLYTGGMRSAQAAQAEAQAAQTQAALDRTREQIAQRTRAAWLDLSVARSRIAALVAALDAGRARLEATRVGLQAGERTTLDLLNAENDAATAELALVESRTRLILRRLQLAALAGELDDAALQWASIRLPSPSP